MRPGKHRQSVARASTFPARMPNKKVKRGSRGERPGSEGTSGSGSGSGGEVSGKLRVDTDLDGDHEERDYHRHPGRVETV